MAYATREITVLNEFGIHPALASEFVRRVIRFDSAVYLEVNGERYRAALVIDVLYAKLEKGQRFTLLAEGPDAERAVNELSRFFTEIAGADKPVPIAPLQRKQYSRDSFDF